MRTTPAVLVLLFSAALLPCVRTAWADDWSTIRKEFRSKLRDTSWKERRAAYMTMLDYDGKKAFEEVLSATLKEENAGVVLEGVKTLGRFETPEALAAFDAALARPRGRKGVLLLLARSEQKGTPGVDELIGILHGKDPQMAMLAAAALGKKAVEPALAALLGVLGHTDWHVVAAAARGVQHIAWSSKTIPDKQKGTLEKPAMPKWFDPRKVILPLIAHLPKAKGPARGAIIEALQSITRKEYGDNLAAWKLVAEGKRPSAAVLRKRTYPTHFFGIPVHTHRVVIVMDINVLADNEHPFQDRETLKMLCRVPGGRDVPWFKIRSVWQFNSAHVKRTIQDLPARSAKFDLIFSGGKPEPVFGKLTGANPGNKQTALKNLEKMSLSAKNDVLSAMTEALDISGSKDSVAWTKGPDTVLCVYSSVPWEAKETDADVIGSTIGLKARMRGVQVHAVGVHEFAYGMMKLFAWQTGGRYLELNEHHVKAPTARPKGR